MAEIVEVKAWTSLSKWFLVEVKSLADLQRIADALKIPFIAKHKKEYLACSGHMGPAPVAYWFRE